MPQIAPLQTSAPRSRPPRLRIGRPPLYVRALHLFELAVVTTFLVLEGVPPLPVDAPLRLVDPNGEANLVAWFSSTQLLIAGLPWMALALLGRRASPETRRDWRTWTDRRFWAPAAIALLFLAWSVDEAALLHEAAGEATDVLLPGGQRDGSPFDKTGIGPLLFTPPLLLLAGALLRAAAPLFPSGTLRLFVIGLLLFLGSASLGDLVGNVTSEIEALRPWQIAGEELGEMLGVTVMLWASFDTLFARARLTIAPLDGRPVAPNLG